MSMFERQNKIQNPDYSYSGVSYFPLSVPPHKHHGMCKTAFTYKYRCDILIHIKKSNGDLRVKNDNKNENFIAGIQ